MRVARRFLLVVPFLLIRGGNVLSGQPEAVRGQPPVKLRSVEKTEVPVRVDDLVVVVEVELARPDGDRADAYPVGVPPGKKNKAPAVGSLFTFRITERSLGVDQLVLGTTPEKKLSALDRRLRRIVDLLGRLCRLSGDQKATLLLAGRGDLRRLLGQLDELRPAFASEYTAVNDSQAGLRRVRDLLKALLPARAKVKEGVFEDGSLFVKTARHVLTADQMAIFARHLLAAESNGRRAKAMSPSRYLAGDAPGRGGGGLYLRSSNAPKAILDGALLERKKMLLVAEPDVRVQRGQQSVGMRLRLVNGTDRTARLLAMDDEVLIVQEALDDDGAWKAIEFIEWSGCGNSFHRLSLKPGEGWEIAAPRYAGPMPTKLRFALKGSEAGEPIYSNEFDGSIDPGQFDP